MFNIRGRAQRVHPSQNGRKRPALSLRLTVYASIYTADGRMTRWSWKDQQREFASFTRYHSLEESDRHRRSRSYCTAIFTHEGTASKRDVIAVTALRFDFDGTTPRNQIKAAFAGRRHIAHSTRRHFQIRDLPRYRVIVPLAYPVDPLALPEIFEREFEGLAIDRGVFDDPAHKTQMPEVIDGVQATYWAEDGEVADFRHVRPRKARPRIPATTRSKHDSTLDPMCDPARFPALMQACGAEPDVEVGQTIKSLIHPDEARPSTRFFVGDDGHLLYKLFHTRRVTVFDEVDTTEGAETDAASTLTLSRLLASRMNGGVIKFKKAGPSHAMWRLRLLFEAGITTALPDIEHRPIDWSSPLLREWGPVERDALREVYDGFLLLLRLRSKDSGEIKPAPYSHRFAALWNGVSVRRAGECVQMLFKLGLLTAKTAHNTAPSVGSNHESD